MPKKIMTPELKVKIIKLYHEDKMLLREVAAMLALSISTVENQIPLDKRRARYKVSEAMQKKIFMMYNCKDLSVKKIAEQLKMSPPTVRTFATAYNKYNLKGELL